MDAHFFVTMDCYIGNRANRVRRTGNQRRSSKKLGLPKTERCGRKVVEGAGSKRLKLWLTSKPMEA